MSLQKIKLAGVIGCPIAHSKSPLLHNSWLRYYDIKGYYVPLHVEEKNFEEIVKILPNMGFQGVNVTLPYKKKAAQIANIRSKDVAFLKVANTLTFLPDGKIKAENTDIYGFLENLKPHLKMPYSFNQKICILGAGGATPAVIVALLQIGFTNIHLANRTYEKALKLNNIFKGKLRIFEWKEAHKIIKNAKIVVNTTSLGMNGQEFPLDLEFLEKDGLAIDIVYTPLRTSFLKKAALQGAKTIDGLGMLLHQAVPGFENWFGIRPNVDYKIRQLIIEKIKK